MSLYSFFSPVACVIQGSFTLITEIVLYHSNLPNVTEMTIAANLYLKISVQPVIGRIFYFVSMLVLEGICNEATVLLLCFFFSSIKLNKEGKRC